MTCRSKGLTPPDPPPDENEYDGGPTFGNGETTVWYDADGEQHISTDTN